MLGKQAKTISGSTLRRMLSYARYGRYPERDRVVILLSVKAGLRACEIARLEWSMILNANDQVADAIDLRDDVAKNRSGRRIPIHPELRTALVALRRVQQTKEEHLAASQVSRGRLLGNRTIVLPTIPTGMFEHLNRLVLRMADRSDLPTFAEGSLGTAQPATWDEVSVGSVVLTLDDEQEAWWEAEVLNRVGNRLVVAWRGDLEQPVWVRTIEDIALQHPSRA